MQKQVITSKKKEVMLYALPPPYCVDYRNYFLLLITACAAANLAIGTRYGEQLT